MPRTRSVWSARSLGLAVLALLALAPLHAVRAQGGVLLQGVADLELWKTDKASALLARNGGRAGPVVHLDMWSAAEPTRNVILFGEISTETGSGRNEPGTEFYLKQVGLRFSPSDAFVLEAGKVPHLVGTFSSRTLSFRNPLVAAPDGYASSYPYGVRLDGTAGIIDYRAGVISLPVTHEDYVPDPSAAPRPAFGLGITPMVGMRLGVSGTEGPYLNHDLPASQLGGQGWRTFRERIMAADAQFSRGYFEAHAEAAHSSYDVPGGAAIDGFAYYAESKYTVAPRVFLAARLERNDYPFITPISATQWIAVRSAFSDLELGVGYRTSAAALLKLSVRADRWTPSPNPGAPQDNGYALAAQWSRQFDVVEMVTRRR